MTQAWYLTVPGMMPPLDTGFRPAVLANRNFCAEVKASGHGVPLVIAVEADAGAVSCYRTEVFSTKDKRFEDNFPIVDRIVKFLLWQRGGWRVVVGGPREVGEYIRSAYLPAGARAFDANLMTEVYGNPFTVEVTTADRVPAEKMTAKPLGRHLEGCRIGFDLGASDRKVSAVKDGQSVFSEEVVWDPRNHADPQYHFNEIMAALKKAASYLPRVDAIGGSSAGIYVGNSVRVASLFRGVPKNLFESRVRGLFHEIQQAWNNIPFEVINDGEVTALAGSMSLGVNRILGIAMGSSLAGGYVDKDGNVIGWLDELAFAPVDYQPDAPLDEWSGDRGCGAMYFSQMAVNRLAPAAGITLDEKKTVPERLKDVQALMAKGDTRAQAVFETIGIYLGYTVAHYADFYDMGHLLVLGRVTSGKGGDIVIARAEEVLRKEFPELAQAVKLAVPDEASRRVGQAIAAASLPQFKL
ncbi:MAG: ROK family protein [Verrucomicrobia bacterium]|nr:ROK family protein [Verrucomicrobiota bacterium]MBU4291004.1 ROK family protein [Verrucomicrobiota bacterium]MBU4428641.1 ROK family protein [Verrucomicrobiota bacterium]MCG2680875.1 ROK family protein [Kiritimatiellia bacterium]